MTRKMVQAVVGLFDTPEGLIKAVEQAPKRGFSVIDAHTPYPVHGLQRALGISPSPLGYLVLLGGLSGALFALAYQGFTSTFDYPLNIGGKPFFAGPAFVPIIFELSVLLAAFSAFFGMLGLLNRLPYLGNPLLRTSAIKEITRNRFGLVVACGEMGSSAEEISEAMLGWGAQSTETISEEEENVRGAEERIPFRKFGLVMGVGFVAVSSGWVFHWVLNIWPDVAPNIYLHEQLKLAPQSEEPFFADEKGMRTPPKGTIARGSIPYELKSGVHDELAGELLVNPLEISEKTLGRGREVYDIFCSVCHGPLGDGKKLLTDEYTAVPANLHQSRIRQMPDGQVFHVITVGKGLMPGYASLISSDDRWAVVNYLRALQRSQNAAEEDVLEAFKDYNVIESEPRLERQGAK